MSLKDQPPVKGVLTVEMNTGQMVDDVKIAVEGKFPVHFTEEQEEMVPTPEAIIENVKKIGGRCKNIMIWYLRRTKGLADVETHYCPGCTHGIIHRLVGEAMVELGVLEKAIGVAP